MDEWEENNSGRIEYFGGKSLLTQSHGHSLMSFFKARYKIKGVYLLDEPETALSPKGQSVIYSFDHIPVRVIHYEDTEHYQIYKSFMENRAKYLTVD